MSEHGRLSHLAHFDLQLGKAHRKKFIITLKPGLISLVGTIFLPGKKYDGGVGNGSSALDKVSIEQPDKLKENK